MKIKICGIKDPAIAKLADECGSDFIGVVFYEKSLRHVEIKDAKKIAQSIVNAKKVAVVVNPSNDYINKINDNFRPDLIQFHGDNNLEFIENFKFKFPNIEIIIAQGVSKVDDLKKINKFINLANYCLLDNVNSGSGQIFDWSILANFNCSKPWFLAGGLNIDNILQAIKISKANMIDISSGLENIKGIKDANLIIALMKKLNKIP